MGETLETKSRKNESPKPESPRPLGPYSLFCVAGDFVFVSGLLGIDPVMGMLGSEPKEEMRIILKNLQRIILPLGLSPADVVKATIFSTRLDVFGELNDVWEEFFSRFSDHLPARSTVGVASLPRGATLEVEFILVMKEPSKLAYIGKHFFLKKDFLRAHEFFERAWARTKGKKNASLFRAFALLSAACLKTEEGKYPSSIIKKVVRNLEIAKKEKKVPGSKILSSIRKLDVSRGTSEVFEVGRELIELFIPSEEV